MSATGMYLYSVIIPHYNSNNLLRRTLDSIPRRSDIQIIVVDDLSTEHSIAEISSDCKYAHVTFFFPGRKVTSGGARNIGIDQSKGEYIIFADSDDYFGEDAFDLFDRYSFFRKEFYQFRAESFLEETGEVGTGTRVKQFKKYYEMANREGLLNILTPWAKLIRRDFLEKFSIRFSEVPTTHGDDIFFSTQLALFTMDFQFCRETIYFVSQGVENSTSARTSSCYIGLLNETIKCNQLICRVHNINLFSFYKDVKHRRWFDIETQVNNPEYSSLLKAYRKSLPLSVRLYWTCLTATGRIQSPQLHFSSSKNCDICYVLRRGKKRELLVHFNDFGIFEDGASESRIFPYNFVNNIPKSSYSVLDIRDFWGSNGGYYYMHNGRFIDNDIFECIEYCMNLMNIAKEDVTLLGHGKGATAALHFYRKYGFSNLIAHHSPLRPGAYLRQYKKKFFKAIETMRGPVPENEFYRELDLLVDHTQFPSECITTLTHDSIKYITVTTYPIHRMGPFSQYIRVLQNLPFPIKEGDL